MSQVKEDARQSLKNQLAASEIENKFSSTMTRIGFIIQTVFGFSQHVSTD